MLTQAVSTIVPLTFFFLLICRTVLEAMNQQCRPVTVQALAVINHRPVCSVTGGCYAVIAQEHQQPLTAAGAAAGRGGDCQRPPIGISSAPEPEQPKGRTLSKFDRFMIALVIALTGNERGQHNG